MNFHKLTRWGLYVLLLVAAIAVGGVHSWTAVALSTIALLLVVATAASGESLSVSFPAVGFLTFAVLCAAQLIPFPEPVHRMLSPSGWAIYEQGWQVMFSTDVRGWRPLSMDPSATAVRGLQWLTIGLAASVASNFADASRAPDKMAWAVISTSAAVFLIGSIHQIHPIDQIFHGFATKEPVVPFTTFVSANHAAVLIFFAALSGAWIALRPKKSPPAQAVAAVVTAAVFAGAALQFESLGTVIAFGFALTALGICQASQFRGLFGSDWFSADSVVTGVMSLIGVGTVLGAGVWVAEPDLLRSVLPIGWLEERSATRLELLQAGWSGFLEFWRFGVGGSAVERTLAPFMDWTSVRPATIPTVENEVCDWLLEFGILGLAGLAALVGYVVIGVWRYSAKKRSRYALGISAALFTLFVTQFHFPFRALGVALPVIVVLETALFPSKATDMTSGKQCRVRPSRGVVILGKSVKFILPAAGVVGLLGFSTAHFVYGTPPVSEVDISKLQSGELAERTWLSPADGDPYLLGAEVALRDKNPEQALDRINYAFEREPKGNIALIRAKILLENGRREAGVRQFVEVFDGGYKRIPTEWIGPYLISIVDKPDVLAEVLGQVEFSFQRVAIKVLRRRNPGFVAEVGLEMQQQFPDQFLPYVLMAQSYIQMDQFVLAELWAEKLLELGPPREEVKRREGFLWVAKAANEAGERTRALNYLIDGINEFPDDLPMARELIRRRPRKPREGSAEAVGAIEDATDSLCDSRKRWTRQPCWLGEGWLAERDGRNEEARFAYQRVAEREDRPRELLEFLSRQGLCRRLHATVEELSEKARERVGQSRITTYQDNCASADE